MRHADALVRSVNAVEKDLVLSWEVSEDEQEKDELCLQYREYENFWTDEYGVLYRQCYKEQRRVVTPVGLVYTADVLLWITVYYTSRCE